MTHTQSTRKQPSLLLTFDYELFLGKRSGSVENCMLKPTREILNLFKEFKIKNSIFFVDTMYLVRLKENEDVRCQKDYNKIVAQIRELQDSGQYIFPHLHPHWLDAVYLPEINEWSLGNSAKYGFSALSTQEKDYVFSSSIAVLEEIVGPQNELGYRAGGWCIQPFESFKPYFSKYNILYDFSVLRGHSSSSDNVYFNFENAPDKVYYHFEDDVCIPEKNGSFIEIPISVIKPRFLKKTLGKVWIKLNSKLGTKNYGDGLSHHFSSFKSNTEDEMISLELLNKVNMPDILKQFKKNQFIHFISHPKMLGSHHINCFRKFLRKINVLQVNTDFKTLIIDQSLVSEPVSPLQLD